MKHDPRDTDTFNDFDEPDVEPDDIHEDGIRYSQLLSFDDDSAPGIELDTRADDFDPTVETLEPWEDNSPEALNR